MPRVARLGRVCTGAYARDASSGMMLGDWLPSLYCWSYMVSGAWVLVSSRASRSRVLGCLLLRELQAPDSGHMMIITPMNLDHTYARVLGCLLFVKQKENILVY